MSHPEDHQISSQKILVPLGHSNPVIPQMSGSEEWNFGAFSDLLPNASLPISFRSIQACQLQTTNSLSIVCSSMSL